jgi:hypothetical protein
VVVVGRDFEPVAGQWYQDMDEQDLFQVLSVNEDDETIEIQYEDGDIEEIDLDTWAEFDLSEAEEPEGWSPEDGDEDDDEDDDWDEDDEDEDEDDDDDEDWDDDEDEYED